MKTTSRLAALAVLFLCAAPVFSQSSKRKKVRRSSRPAPATVHFITGSNSVGIPFEMSSNLILIQAQVNNSTPLWFIFDTGASDSVIDSQVAKTMHLKSRGTVRGNASAARITATLFKGNSLTLPNLEALNLTLAGLPIDFLSSPVGRKISGVLGNDVIGKLVVEIDYASQVVNLYEPSAYRYSGNGETIPLTLEEKLPFVRARIAMNKGPEVEGKFELDTGSTGAITLNTPFVDRHRLLTLLSNPNQSRLAGVGGSALAFSGRLKTVGLGKLQLSNAITRFSRAASGDDNSRKYDGLIGGDIFYRFKVIVDYSRGRIILEPNANFDEPFEADMSGLDLATDGDDYSIVMVNEVEKDSPGARAGLQEGDVIVAIDGRPAKEITINRIRRMFMKDGKEYSLSVKRDQKELQAKLKLKRLI